MGPWFALLAIAMLVAGCSGVDIRPISPALEREAHARDGAASGYVVYGPMVVVEVAVREVCLTKDKASCEVRCAAGAPFVLPDLSKPFLVDVRNGFGKSGVDVGINDGWRLGSLKDQTDNSAILGSIEKLALSRMGIAADATTKSQPGGCAKAGLYRVDFDGREVRLVPLLGY